METVGWFADGAFTGPGRSSIFCFRNGTDCSWDRSGRVAFGVGLVAGVVRSRYEWTDVGAWHNLEKFRGGTSKCRRTTDLSRDGLTSATGDKTPRKPLRNSMGVQGANHPQRMGTIGRGRWFGEGQQLRWTLCTVLHADDGLRLADFSHACSLPSDLLRSVEFEGANDLQLCAIYRANPDVDVPLLTRIADRGAHDKGRYTS